MKPIFILLLCFSLSTLHAQQNDSVKNFLQFGVGYVHKTIYDEAISQLRYQRGGILPDLGWMRFSPKTINQLHLSGSYLGLHSDQRNDLIASKVSSIEGSIQYDHLRLLKHLPKNWDWYAGGRAELFMDVKMAPQIDNSSLLYDYALSIGASSAMTKTFHWTKRNPFLFLQVNLPLLSHISRPPYFNRIEFIDVKNELVSDFFAHSKITSLNGLLRLQTAAEFYYPIRSGNFLRLSYRWDFYKMKTINRSFSGEQQLVFSFLMNI